MESYSTEQYFLGEFFKRCDYCTDNQCINRTIKQISAGFVFVR